MFVALCLYLSIHIKELVFFSEFMSTILRDMEVFTLTSKANCGTN